jgi:uncharacterized membrane protein HdeD (DUF308 family)
MDKSDDQPLRVSALLGVVLIAAGVIVLGDVVLATFISTVLIGAVAVAGGLFEIVYAWSTKGRNGYVAPILLGLLYIGLGIALISQPITSAVILTFPFGLVLMVSGLVRIYLGIGYWADNGWLLLVSGIIGVLAGLVILTGWPTTGLWLIGTLLGIDLLAHGAGWMALTWLPSARAS